MLIEEKSHRFNRNFLFVVKSEYIYRNTNIYLTQENADIFKMMEKMLVSTYNQVLLNAVFRRFCKISSDQNNDGRSLCNRILNLGGALIF